MGITRTMLFRKDTLKSLISKGAAARVKVTVRRGLNTVYAGAASVDLGCFQTEGWKIDGWYHLYSTRRVVGFDSKSLVKYFFCSVDLHQADRQCIYRKKLLGN